MNILDQIVAVKQQEVAKLRPQAGRFRQDAAARTDFRDFAGAIAKPVSLIAEIKKASPSAGVIAPNFDAINIAREYEAAGVNALSVLTDEQFFQGRLEYLQLIRDAVRLPLLRKDFVVDELQIYQSAARGADAILLITGILDHARLKSFRQLAEQLRMAALVEVHDEQELERAVGSGASLIGVNNRDLRDFSVNLATTERLAMKLKRGMCAKYTLIAESGINTRADVERVAKAGAAAILVGESLMRSGNIAGKVKELLGR